MPRDETAHAGTRILCVAGKVRSDDWRGHHDYVAGCGLLADLLNLTPGVSAEVVGDGWPEDPQLLEGVSAIVFYDRGGGKQGFLGAATRIDRLQKSVDAGAGLVMVHQTLGFPRELSARGIAWMGGAYVPGFSRRGHWKTHHRDFPDHAITAGVRPWKIRDGWLNRIQFVAGMNGVTPLVWSGRRHRGAREGGAEDVVGWAYERAGGGRSFSFTGIDAHSAWSSAGLRQLMVNAVLWSAGVAVPDAGAPSEITEAQLASYLTPRRGRATKTLASLMGSLTKALRGPKW